MTGLDEVEGFLAGNGRGYKVHVPDEVDVKSIRNKLRMTQARFSDTFGFSLDAIKHWEGGRRKPEAPARTLLTVIDRNPAAVLTALQPRKLARVRTPGSGVRAPGARSKAGRFAAKAGRARSGNAYSQQRGSRN